MQGEASIFHVAMGRSSSSCKSTLTIEQVTSIAGIDKNEGKTSTTLKLGINKDEKTDKSSQESFKSKSSASGVNEAASGDEKPSSRASGAIVDVCAATFLDVAVLRCLFVAQWQEEGIYWALQFLYNRFVNFSTNYMYENYNKKIIYVYYLFIF